MTANKNEPDKKAGSAPSQTPAARPHATIDLKATEVPPPAEAAKTAEKAGAEKKPNESKDGPAAKTAATASSPDAKTSASAQAASATTDKAAKSGTSVPPAGSPPPRQPSRGFGGFFTHVAAGIAGGVIALLAANALNSQLGLLAMGEPPNRFSALDQRLAALEASAGQGNVSAELATRLAATETKLGVLDQLDANINGVSKRQGEFSREIAALEERLKGDSPAGDLQPRISKLEEQLQLMSTAAERDPQSGQLPQLAAITGKLADLESTVTNQLDALRLNLNQEVDTRLSAATEAGQAARSGTQRMDRELSTLKAETAEISTGLSNIKSDSDRANAALKTTQEDVRRLKEDIATRLATYAKPEHVTAAVAPVAGKLDALERNVQDVIKSEGDRRTTAERIVLSLELANLKRAIDRGQPYAAELKQAREVAGGSVDLAPLERFALEGVSTPVELRQEFRPVAFKIIDAQEAPAEASIVDRLLAGAKSVVRVRRTDHAADDKSVEAVVGRMETALNEDRLADVLREAKDLPPPAQEAARDFLAKVEARASVESALTTVENQLKASLAAAPAANPDRSAQ